LNLEPSNNASEHGTRVKQHARAHFDQWALSYDRSWLNELVFYPSVRACHEEILRWQAGRGAAPYGLLDVGCGTGKLLVSLARDPAARLLVGLDYSPAMARRAAEKAATVSDDGRMTIVVGDSQRLPFADRAFDVVTCCNSFHHYPHQDLVAQEFRRVLRPGGLLVLIDGFRDNIVGWVVFDVFVATVEGHVHHASWSEVHAWLLAAKFSAVRHRKSSVLAPLLITTAHV
jgi:ubiquinone/menaquinone biosynthesis C-methylase UbiE